MTVTQEERPMGPHPFGLFLVLSDPTYGQNISSKAVNHFGYLPRQIKRISLLLYLRLIKFKYLL